MSTEAEIVALKKQNADLEAKLKMLTTASEVPLVLLPNGDLHRGIRPELASMDPEVQIIPAEQGTPLNQMVAKVLLAAKGAQTLTCLWCGLQFYGQLSEKEVREHLRKDHKSLAEGHSDKLTAEVLAATLASTEAELAKATKAA